jgi:hypothetical protein
MTQNRIIIFTLAVLIAVSAIIAADRYLAATEAKNAVESKRTELDEAKRLISVSPETFESPKSTQDMKLLIQRLGTQYGIAVNHLSEQERDLSDTVRERSIDCRLANVPQDKLVSFLGELEDLSAAKVKDLRLKPAVGQSGVYAEVEAVITTRTLLNKKPSARGKL